MTHSLKSKCALLLTLLLTTALPAHAAQIIETSDGSTIHARLSRHELTRLSLDHGRLATLRVKDGELVIEPDDETGQMFLAVPPNAKKPINGFLTTEAGQTFTLVLEIVDAPADSIVIKQANAQTSALAGFKASSYDKTIQRLITAMAHDERPDTMLIRDVRQKLDLWQETAVTLERQFVAAAMVGERYVVVNVSREPMLLDEREFYRKGVSAVAIEQLNLAPGASTHLYVIREKNQHE